MQLSKDNESDCYKLIQALEGERPNFIDKLSSETGKNAQKANKFLSKYR